jgi:hypothetical protein
MDFIYLDEREVKKPVAIALRCGEGTEGERDDLGNVNNVQFGSNQNLIFSMNPLCIMNISQ